MYKHSADSIKESSRKRFLSQSEKDKFNNYEEIFIEKTDVHTKDEIDEIVSDLDSCIETHNSRFVNVEGTRKGTVNLHEIIGNSTHPMERIIEIPVMEAGTINQSTGTNEVSDGYIRTRDYIEVKEGEVLHFDKYYIYEQFRDVTIIKYDETKSFIFADFLPYGKKYTVGRDEKFIRICTVKNESPDTIFRINRTKVDYYKLRSLGDLQEDGTYKITVVSSGKNIVGDRWEQGYIDGQNGTYINLGHDYYFKRVRSEDFIPVDKSKTHIMYSVQGDKNRVGIRFFDEHKEFIYIENLIGFLPVVDKHIIEIPKNAMYYKIVLGDITGEAEISPESISNDDLGIQFEYGKEKTDYEPFISSKSDIILPCSLEKIGDYADKLFKRGDGKWCIEKNIKTMTISSKDKFVYDSLSSNENTDRFIMPVTPNIKKLFTKYYPVFSSKLKCVMRADSDNNITDLCTNIYAHNGSDTVHIKRLKAETLFTDEVSLNKLMINSELKYVLETPEIIELDNGIHYLLESFDGMTNIYIQGSNAQPSSIKVDISKSMMGSVNLLSKSLTEIDNRVDKINSVYNNTKSLYKTTSGSLTIEGCTNGVIEDVKLEGNTLINLCNPKFIQLNHSNAYDADRGIYIFNANGEYKNLFTRVETLKPNREYTIYAECIENTLESSDGVSNINLFTVINDHPDSSFIEYSNTGFVAGETGVKVKCLTSNSNALVGLRSFLNKKATSGHIKIRIMIIEGDHTDKPLSYFKGIKSSGEDLESKSLTNMVQQRQTLGTGLTYNKENNTYTSTIQQTRFVSEPITVYRNKYYTLMYEFMCDNDFTVNKYNESMVCRIDAEDSSGTFVKTYAHLDIGKTYKANKWYKISSVFKIDNSNVSRIIPCIRNNVNGVNEISMRRVMVVEGIHEFGSLPYFEDEQTIVDPIKLSTINLSNLPNDINFMDINISDINGNNIDAPGKARISTDFIDISEHTGNIEVAANGNRADIVEKICFYNSDKKYLGFKYNKVKEKVFKAKIPNNSKFARIVMFTVDFEKPTGMYINMNGDRIFNDRKSVSYLKDNDWCPVILRSLPNGIADTVEKHEDGKYYYHKRCETAILNGTEPGWKEPINRGELSIQFILEGYPTNITTKNRNPDKPQMYADNIPYSDNSKIGSAYLDPITFGISQRLDGLHGLFVGIPKSYLTGETVADFKTWLGNNPTTIIYELAEEEVYECSNIDLMLFSNSTTLDVHSGPVIPKVSIYTSGNIGNTIQSLKERVLLLENSLLDRATLHNRLMLSNRYSADRTKFNVNVVTLSANNRSCEIDVELIKLILSNISEGVLNYSRDHMEELIDFYTIIGIIPFEVADRLFELIESQYFEPSLDETL